jgi:hypothetical protein
MSKIQICAAETKGRQASSGSTDIGARQGAQLVQEPNKAGLAHCSLIAFVVFRVAVTIQEEFGMEHTVSFLTCAPIV